MLRDSSVEPVVLPPQGSNLNAHGERLGHSTKEEVLNHLCVDAQLAERATQDAEAAL
jgi:hypothetical protein